tara:strand:+ start:4298 stop:5233 length:936 start_codon:yes stop_codon:yes gene_type:complete
MKLVSFEIDNQIKMGSVEGDMIYDLNKLDDRISNSVLGFIKGGQNQFLLAESVINKNSPTIPVSNVNFLSPVLNPPSVRDAYAFRQHVLTARQNRGLDMIPEFDEIPIFYFTNHNEVYGSGKFSVLSKHLDKLDFELECAAVIGKGGTNISASEADKYIFGFMIMNDFSARGLQMQEMKLNLGPAKGKDFGSSFGPYLVTKDELEPFKSVSKEGDRYNLEMKAYVNDIQVSQDNLSNMTWSFAQIIERVSYGVDIFPGDIIGSGTCGTGCFLELNGSNITKNQWLLPKDKIVLEIEGLGSLENQIHLNESI